MSLYLHMKLQFNLCAFNCGREFNVIVCALLLPHLTWRLGKTTLFNLLTGMEQPDSGECIDSYKDNLKKIKN